MIVYIVIFLALIIYSAKLLFDIYSKNFKETKQKQVGGDNCIQVQIISDSKEDKEYNNEQ